MRPWACLVAGSVVGGVSRYLMAGWVFRAAGCEFPYGTLAVNLAGCLLIGLFEGLAEGHGALIGQEGRLLLMTGFCGAFTTFSTLALEMSNLLRSGHLARAATYVIASVLVGLLLLNAGILLGRAVPR